ncbi:MAG: hypothetical protein KDB90_04445 [Planctomycetes bacterium]|nr:hypothetical protein [Planctomycetota bacterium]
MYATDGVNRTGLIMDADVPFWELGVDWSGELEANATAASSGSTHRANSGQYAVLQGSISGDFGQEYDVYYNWSNPSTTYSFSYTFGGLNYTGSGAKKYDGGYSLVSTPGMILSAAWIPGDSFSINLYNRGWMSIQTNGQTTAASTSINGADGNWSGFADAWDLGPSPAIFIQSFPIS